MEFTTNELQAFQEWKNSKYNGWTTYRERKYALTREFIKTLKDEDIKNLFKLGKRNAIESKNDEKLKILMVEFMKKAQKVLKLNPKYNGHKENIKDCFEDNRDIMCDEISLTRIIKILNSNIPNDIIILQRAIDKVFNGNYYSIPYSASRTIERYHSGEILHGIFNKFGGVAIVKTARKMIGVKLKVGEKNSLCPVSLKEAIKTIKEMRDEKNNEVNVDDTTLNALKEQIEIDELARAI